MDFDAFRESILTHPTDDLLENWLNTERPAAFQNAEAYRSFRDAIAVEFPGATFIGVAGTANWRFSLNPQKGFKEFDRDSDIDTILVDRVAFDVCWDAIRERDRFTKYTRQDDEERPYRSAASSIYSGFVAPVWILESSVALRYEFRSKLNRVSRTAAGGRSVKALYFKSWPEVKDYYRRGVMLAKVKLK